ncbi:MAG: MFS transporter [Candidatus Dormibacteraeota bacterium]|uniref:MFS transporter n=1 Tax=Candidatus Amunia macphersoniae TaxID=3127014 RepID=A0A934NE17_9BACT|nr:MFS transporter [Candidatus Dormibacteraeota bacterium]
MAIDFDPAAPEGVAGTSVRGESAVPAPGAPSGRAAVVRFFLSVFLSLYGDWLTTVALVVLLYELTGSPAGPAGYLLVRVAPRVIGPWIGGGLADRLSPRRVMVIAGLVQGAFTASFVLSDRAHAIWALYTAVAIAQFVGSLVRPSQGALLQTLVSSSRLTQANALYGTFFSTSIFVGPAIGALLLLHTGPDLLFAIDAVTFLVGAILAATLPSGRVTSAVPRSAGAGLPSQSAFALGARDPVIRLVAAANFAMGLTVTVAQALLVVAARERFGSDAAVGILYSAVGIGGTLGGLFALRWTPPHRHIRLLILIAAIVEVVGLASFAAVSVRATGLLLLAASTVASAIFDVWGLTEIQRRAPAGYVGRFNAIPWTCQYAGMLVGAVWALGTTVVFRWDQALELACLGMAVLVATAGVIGTAAAAPEPQAP